MIKKISLLAFFLLPLLLAAQSKLPANMFLRALPNGLQVLVVEDNSVPLATLMMTFKAGMFTQTENTCGLTALYQGLLQQNNKNFPDYQYNAGGLGVQSMNSFVTEEYANFYFTLPKVNLDEGLNLMYSSICLEKTDPEELEKEKKIVTGNMSEKESTPSFALTTANTHHLWGDLYARKTGAIREVLNSASLTELVDSVRNKYYYPNNALLIVGGDVSHENVFNNIEKLFGGWASSGFDPFKRWPIPEFKPIEKNDYYIVESPLSRTPVISINWQGPDTRNDINSTYAADVFSYIVNQGSSKLSTALIKSGLAFSASINYLTLKHVGPISLVIRPNPARIKECMDEVRRQISIMDTPDYFPDDQIETAKRTLEIKKIRQEEITTEYVHTLSFWWASASLDYFAGYNDRLQKVSKAEVVSYVKKYIKKPYCAGLLISPALKTQSNAETFFTDNN